MNITRSFTQQRRQTWSGATMWMTSSGWQYQRSGRNSRYNSRLRQTYTLAETDRKTVNLSEDFSFGITASGFKPRAYAARNSTFNLSGDLTGSFSATTHSSGDFLRSGYRPGGFGGGGCPPWAMYRSKVYGDDGAQSLSFTAEAHTNVTRPDGSIYSYGVDRSTLSLGGGDDSVSIESTAFAVRNRPIYWRGRGWSRVYQDVTEAHARGVQYSTIDMGTGDDDLTITANHEVEGYDPVTGVEVNRRSDAISLDRSTIRMGDGNDSLTLSGNGVHARYSTVDMGAGDDVLTMGGKYAEIQRNTFKGGEGFDQVVLTSDHYSDRFEQGRAQALFARTFDIQNGQLGTVGNDVSASFKYNGNTFEGFEQIAVAGGVFDTTTSSFV